MRSITADQSQQVMGTLMVNTDWESIDFEGSNLQEAIVRDPKGAGERFTAFLKNGCHFVFGEPKVIAIDPNKHFNPIEFLGKGWSVWLGPVEGDGLVGEPDQDVRELELTSVDLANVSFETCLEKGESSISGEEKLKRLILAGNIRFGGNVFFALWEDYQACKENSILEWLYRNRKVGYLDFMGLILRHPNGNRYVLCLFRYDDGQWDWNYCWLGYDWDADGLSVGCAS